jgi:hypothetical protein
VRQAVGSHFTFACSDIGAHTGSVKGKKLPAKMLALVSRR